MLPVLPHLLNGVNIKRWIVDFIKCATYLYRDTGTHTRIQKYVWNVRTLNVQLTVLELVLDSSFKIERLDKWSFFQGLKKGREMEAAFCEEMKDEVGRRSKIWRYTRHMIRSMVHHPYLCVPNTAYIHTLRLQAHTQLCRTRDHIKHILHALWRMFVAVYS